MWWPIVLAFIAIGSGRAFADTNDVAGISQVGDKIAGTFAGALLAGLVVYGLWVAARPLIKQRDRSLLQALLLLTGLLIAKIVAVGFVAGYPVDVGTYEAWALQMAAGGPVSMYRAGYFVDYPPGYLYALWAAGWLASAIDVTSPAALRVIVEAPALLADLALAALMYIFLRRSGSVRSAWAAMLLIALNPALVFDTVGWGQTDSALALVLLLSVVMMLDEEIELGWCLAALALLIKPQTVMLLPVLILWTLRKCNSGRWWRAALAFVAVIVVGVAPFQAGHSWNWLPELYLSTGSYYRETSVNAFNLMSLLGGLRQSDAGTVLSVSYFSLGMALLALLYGAVAALLWRHPTARNFIFASFISLFGFFMVAPRMHERYLYVALVLALPLAVVEFELLAIFLTLTATCLFNLAYVLHALNTVVFLEPRDRLAMVASAVNVILFAGAAAYWYSSAADPVPGTSIRDVVGGGWVRRFFVGSRQAQASSRPLYEVFAPLRWAKADTAIMIALTVAAAALRFWHLGHPPEIVFDEVHFVGQARHYLRGEPFLDPHPPIAKLVIACGILLFGDHPWSWRLGNAILGTILVAVTYLLGRRMFNSRLAGTLAAVFVACDGFFIVDSRIGCIDIVYLTFAGISYWLLFRFMGERDFGAKRWSLILIGVALGLCLGSKLYVPAITFLLVGGFVFYSLWRGPNGALDDRSNFVRGAQFRFSIGAFLMLGSISVIFYLAAFLPHFLLGWWGGIADLGRYYVDVIGYEKSVATATHPYASPWWSWPLMLRPVAYWQNFPRQGNVATIWGAGNPLTWWAVIPAMTITVVRLLESPTVTRAFLAIGFLGYLVIWIPIGRVLFLYHYMPSVYIGYLALAGIIADCWNGEAETWENLAIILTIAPVLLIGLGHIAITLKPSFLPAGVRAVAGLPFAILLGVIYLLLFRNRFLQNRLVAIAFLTVAAILFVYFLPIWLGTPIPRSGYYARMWFEGPGLRNWI